MRVPLPARMGATLTAASPTSGATSATEPVAMMRRPSASGRRRCRVSWPTRSSRASGTRRTIAGKISLESQKAASTFGLYSIVPTNTIVGPLGGLEAAATAPP